MRRPYGERNMSEKKDQKHECNNCKHISDDVMTGNRCYKCIFDKIDGWEAKDEDNGS